MTDREFAPTFSLRVAPEDVVGAIIPKACPPKYRSHIAQTVVLRAANAVTRANHPITVSSAVNVSRCVHADWLALWGKNGSLISSLSA